MGRYNRNTNREKIRWWGKKFYLMKKCYIRLVDFARSVCITLIRRSVDKTWHVRTRQWSTRLRQ